jgi:putative nucleotidyltransferase with HDIG domain
MVTADCKRLVNGWFNDGSLGERLPEVEALKGVPQPNEFHAEGDAYVHTMLAIEAVEDDADQRVFWAVLLHDIGKAKTTSFVNGHWRSSGHGEEGAKLVREIMSRLGFPGLADDVAWLVRHHDFILSWNLEPGYRLTPRQLRSWSTPSFPFFYGSTRRMTRHPVERAARGNSEGCWKRAWRIESEMTCFPLRSWRACREPNFHRYI